MNSAFARLWGALRGTRSEPAVGCVRFGDLRRTVPLSREFGYDRGLPVDRFYIERFLRQNARSIRGRVLEVGDDSYTRHFGGDRVNVCDVLHVEEGNPSATIVGDLASADHVPSDWFDCVVLTQTLQLVFDLGGATRTLHRILKPGGTLLLTVPGITQLSDDNWAETWYWSFTPLAVERLFAPYFPGDLVVQAHGNVLTAAAFLFGLASQELNEAELMDRDSRYPMLITVRAVK